MGNSRGKSYRIPPVLLKLIAAACFLNLAEVSESTAATSLKITSKCIRKEGSIMCNRLDLTDEDVSSGRMHVGDVTNFTASFNKITRVPGVLRKAADLKMLNLTHNYISFLNVSDFQGMKSLAILNLSFNQLTEVNMTGEELNSLIILDLSNNALRTFYINGDKINKLKTLDLSNNNLRNNLDFLQALPKIKQLYLDLNGISEIHNCVREDSELHYLSLKGNNLINVAFVNSCQYLHRLDLSSNNITEIPETWPSNFTLLNFFSIANNSVENADFLRTIFVLPDLKHLDISRNRIKYIDHSHIEAKNISKKIKHVDVSHNKLVDISFVNKMESIAILIADNNNITFIANPLSLPQLTKLSLSNNKLSDLKFLTYLPNLEHVDLSYNSINNIPNVFKKITKLRSLNISNNSLSHFESLQNSPNIMLLNISNNKLKKFPCNPYIKYLYIDGNEISDLIVKCLPNLRLLSVFGTVIQNKYSIPLHEASSLVFQTPNQCVVECIPTEEAVIACSKACEVSSLRDIFCSRVVNTASTSMYIGIALGLIALLLALLLIRYRLRIKRTPRRNCTCVMKMEESRY